MLEKIPHGTGYYIHQSGEVLLVNWINGLPDGYGIIIDLDGFEHEIYFDEGELVE